LLTGGQKPSLRLLIFTHAFHWDLDVSILWGGDVFRSGSPAAGHTHAMNR
jgi:hypothetical protein